MVGVSPRAGDSASRFPQPLPGNADCIPLRQPGEEGGRGARRQREGCINLGGLVACCVIAVTIVFGIRNSLLQYEEPPMEQLQQPAVSTHANRLCRIPKKE